MLPNLDTSSDGVVQGKGKTAWDNMSIERREKRIGRLLRLHERVIDTPRSKFLGEGFSDGSGSSVFLDFGKKWGVLWYNNPEKARKIHDHYMYCTNVVSTANSQNKINPIFEPVWMHPENSRPYLVRKIPGDSFSNYLQDNPEKLLLQNFFWKFLNPYLKNAIAGLNFTDPKNQFDIKPENILVNPLMGDVLKREDTIRELQDLEKLRGNQRKTVFLSLLNKWNLLGARFYLFDYGTWIKPDGTDKYGKTV